MFSAVDFKKMICGDFEGEPGLLLTRSFWGLNSPGKTFGYGSKNRGESANARSSAFVGSAPVQRGVAPDEVACCAAVVVDKPGRGVGETPSPFSDPLHAADRGTEPRQATRFVSTVRNVLHHAG